MNAILIAFTQHCYRHKVISPPLGLYYLASVLKRQKVGVELIDIAAQRYPVSRILKEIKNKKPDIAGVSFTTDRRFRALSLIKEIKRVSPDTLLIAGGHHVSAAAEDTLRNIKELDIIVRGEGEMTLSELAVIAGDGGAYKNMLGISYRDKERIIHNQPRPLIRDLDTLPFPEWGLVDKKKYSFEYFGLDRRYRGASIITSRGCPFRCIFCETTRMWQGHYRARSPTNILAEIKELVERYKIELLSIEDDIFTFDRSRTMEICRLLINANIGIKWICFTRADMLDRELLKIMKESGCIEISLGVESGSQKILDEVIGKKINLGQVRNVAVWCHELNIRTRPMFILGFPGETREDLNRTLELANWWPKNSTRHFSTLVIYPGTGLEKLARQKGILSQNFSWSKDCVYPCEFDVPIFTDLIPWSELSRVLFRLLSPSVFNTTALLKEGINNIRSPKDFARCVLHFILYIKMRLRRLFVLGK